MSQFDSDIKDFKVGKTTISGGTATVPVKLTLFTHESAPTETPYDTELRLIKEGGVWKVDKWVEVHNFNF